MLQATKYKRVFDPRVPIQFKEINLVKKTLRKSFWGAMILLTLSGSALTHAAGLTPAETKAIAEEGYIFGLPLVMNYAIMNEYAVDKNSNRSRHRSTRSRTSRASLPTKTLRSSARTAIRLTQCPGWTCVPNLLLSQFLMLKRAVTTLHN